MLQFSVRHSIGASLLPTSALLPTQLPDSKPQPQDDGKDGVYTKIWEKNAGTRRLPRLCQSRNRLHEDRYQPIRI
jgi:hypothetical protein